MITRIFADNFKCLSAFEVALEGQSLLMGPNGSGKTTLISLFSRLRDFILGNGVAGQLFPRETLTRWDTRTTQTFELETRSKEGQYRYRLTLQHQPETAENRIVEEALLLDGKPLVKSDADFTRIYSDKHVQKVEFPADWRSSSITRVRTLPDSKRVVEFRRLIESMLVLAPNPALISAVSDNRNPVTMPDADCRNFASWLRHVAAADALVRNEAERKLAEVLPGFRLFEARPAGDAAILHCIFEVAGQPIRFRLDELSSGQIAMIVIQTAISVASSCGGILVLDEPGNFLALAEIQPLFTQLSDLQMDGKCQVIMAAHHPIAADDLAASCGLWLERDRNGPVRAQRIKVDPEVISGKADIRISELVARGWLSGLGISSSAS
jgi:predicted ATPase